ncbi:MAG: ThiF family adenylyltransferase [Candidatus Sulfotelmatobacter sp.]
MSQQLISRNADLQHLRNDGYDILARGVYLVVRGVPYVNSRREVKRGTLVSELSLAGDVTIKPATHVIYFAGEYPCNADGSEIGKIRATSQVKQLDRDLVVQHLFSSKADGGYKDHYEKMVTYAAILSGPAHEIDPSAKAQTFPLIEPEDEDCVFKYCDTASSRAEITAVTRKLELKKLAIVGVGGTGSYVLDLIAKTPVKEIHIFEGDKLLQHNAFRSPGAPSADELRQVPTKVAYFKAIYSEMHRGIIPHEYFIDASNIGELREMQFVFLCMDKGEAKKLIVKKLEEWGIPFIDVGMGIDLTDDAMGGILRVTTSTPQKRAHVWEKDRIPFSDGDGNDEYSRNIQIADLNALNAALAVVKWKKLFGFYRDLEHEHFTTYTIDGNTLVNEDQA